MTTVPAITAENPQQNAMEQHRYALSGTARFSTEVYICAIHRLAIYASTATTVPRQQRKASVAKVPEACLLGNLIHSTVEDVTIKRKLGVGLVQAVLARQVSTGADRSMITCFETIGVEKTALPKGHDSYVTKANCEVGLHRHVRWQSVCCKGCMWRAQAYRRTNLCRCHPRSARTQRISHRTRRPVIPKNAC